MSRILYLTYDGLNDPLGRSQVCPYIRGLALKGHMITVISFEKDVLSHEIDANSDFSVASLLGPNTRWIALRYHKRFRIVATALDIAHAGFRSIPLMRQTDIVHLRSYVLGPVALLYKKASKAKLLFDIRGFWVQERIDAQLISEHSLISKVLHSLERALFRNADWICTLTRRSIPRIQQLTKKSHVQNVTVIPTAVNTQKFRNSSGMPRHGRRTFCYAGSLGTWYDSETLLQVAKCVVMGGDVFRLATKDSDSPIVKKFLDLGVQIDNLPHESVPNFLSECDVFTYFIHPKPSKVASCPTKLGEALAAGLPVLTTPGIGDVDEIVERNRVGLVVRDVNSLNCQSLQMLVNALLEDQSLAARCRATAESEFSLDRAIEEYDSVYAKLDPK